MADQASNPVAIELAGGAVTWVDPEDVALVSRWRWAARRSNDRSHTAYATRGRPILTPSGYRTVLLHRLIMDAPPGLQVDHADRDGLNNTRANLRLCTPSRNCANSIQRIGTSGYRGVKLSARGTRWEARIQVHGRRLFLGHFGDPEEAARAYDNAARHNFGEFARLNFPAGDGEQSAYV